MLEKLLDRVHRGLLRDLMERHCGKRGGVAHLVLGNSVNASHVLHLRDQRLPDEFYQHSLTAHHGHRMLFVFVLFE